MSPIRNMPWAGFPLLLACALAFAGAAHASPAADSPTAGSSAAEPSAADSSGGTAILVFLAYHGTSHPSFEMSALHARAWDFLVRAARERGIDAPSRSVIEPLLYKWRVRNSIGISSGFVQDVSSELRCPQLLIADLAVYSDRLILMARRTRSATGEVVSCGIAETQVAAAPEPGRDIERILESTETASRSLLGSMQDRASPPAGHVAFVLPTRRSGIDGSAADLAGYCLLHALLRTTWRIHDPGLAFTQLCAAGLDPTSLDPGVRPELAEAGGDAAILIGNVASYGVASAPVAFLEESEIPAGQLQFPSIALSLRWIDAQTGDIVFASTEYIEPPPQRGLFGLARITSLTQRIQPAADRLVAGIKG